MPGERLARRGAPARRATPRRRATTPPIHATRRAAECDRASPERRRQADVPAVQAGRRRRRPAPPPSPIAERGRCPSAASTITGRRPGSSRATCEATMPTPAISIHDPSTTPRASGGDADGERQRAQAGRRVDADEPDLVGGVGVDAVLRPRVGGGGGASPTSSRRRARRAPSPSAAARPRPGRRRRASRWRRSRVKYTVTPTHRIVSSLTAAGLHPASGRRAARLRLLLGATGGSAPPRVVVRGRSTPRGADRADVGVVHPAEVEHRPLRADRRQPREVVRRRRRRRRPLQRVGLPRVGAHRSAAERSDRTTLIGERHERQRRARPCRSTAIMFSGSKSSTSARSRRPAAACRRDRGCASRRTSVLNPIDQQPEVPPCRAAPTACAR